MSKLLKKRHKKAGLSPGILVHIGEIKDPEIHVEIIDYDESHLIEKKDVSIRESLDLKDKPSVTWINVQGIHDAKSIEAIGSHFKLHPLILEDIMNSGQRSKLDDYKDHIFIVMRTLKYNKETEEIEDEQVSIILGKTYVISFVEADRDIFEPIRKRIRNINSRLRQRGPDYLCYALIDMIVDHYFGILERVDQQLEDLEEKLVLKPNPHTPQKIQHTKREITLLRKAIWPMREVISSFRRIDSPLVQESTKLYLQDIYDHTIQAIDTIESFRDIVAGMFDVYLSNINLHMNEIMKVLTIVATIFVPLTFIASLYGMNFEHMPGIHSKAGYYLTLLVMLISALGMIYFFRRKKWL